MSKVLIKMSYIYVFINKSQRNIYNTLIITNDKVVINNTSVSITEIGSIEGEIRHHTRLDEYSGEKTVSLLLPVGFVKFRITNRDEIVVETVNPLNIVEDIVIRLNIFLDRINEAKFYLKERSTYRVVYSRV